MDAAVAALPALRALPGPAGGGARARRGLELVAAHLGEPLPARPVPPCALLVELAGDADGSLDELAGALDALGAAVVASAAADDATGVARLWRWREAHTEAAAALGVVHKADVTLPLGAMAAFVGGGRRRSSSAVAPGATVLVYGHLADGNLHVNVVGPAARRRPTDRRGARPRRSSAAAASARSTASAPPSGGGSSPSAGEAAVEAMRAIKAALDPDRHPQPRRAPPMSGAACARTPPVADRRIDRRLRGCWSVAATTGTADETDGLDGTVTMLAASSLTDAFGEIATAFEAEHEGVDVELSFDGSAKLATAIIEGRAGRPVRLGRRGQPDQGGGRGPPGRRAVDLRHQRAPDRGAGGQPAGDRLAR